MLGVSLALVLLSSPSTDPGALQTLTLQGLIAKTPRLEIMAVPPATKDVAASRALSAWKTVSRELKRAKKRLKMSTKLQRQRHDFLLGPAREQAGDCGEDIGCLVEIGSTLGADILITGRLDRDALTLVAIDVQARERIASVSSSEALASKGPKRKAKNATRRLIADLLQAGSKDTEPGTNAPAGVIAASGANPRPSRVFRSTRAYGPWRPGPDRLGRPYRNLRRHARRRGAYRGRWRTDRPHG